MHAFQKETANYEFELKKDDLYISIKGEPDKNLRWHESEGYEELSSSRGMPHVLVIKDYLERIKTPEASKIVETVLSAFYRTFKPREDQREQLRKSLRYFSLADHYGVLGAAFPSEVLGGVKVTYNNLKEKLADLERDHTLTEAMIRKFHINEPLVASTGLVVYATVNYNWYMFETNERNAELPEYKFSVIQHTDFKINTSMILAFTGSQNDCQRYILDKQKDIYGVSLDEFKLLERKLEINSRLAEDFETLLNLDYKDTIKGKHELAEKEAAIKESVETNLQQFNFGKEATGYIT